MTKSKAIAAAVRLFGGASTSETQRPTIETSTGPIYAGTPEARAYLEAKAWMDPLSALSKALDTMLYDKPQALQDIDALIPKVPEEATRIRATLLDLSEAMQGRVSNQSGTNFRPDAAGPAYAAHVQELRNHAERCRFGLEAALGSAPRPPYHLAVPAPTRQQLGTWFRQFGGGQ